MESRTALQTLLQISPEQAENCAEDSVGRVAVGREEEWPQRPPTFGELLTVAQAAQYLRLDEIGHTPKSASRVLSYWRNKGQLKATKFARHVWFLRSELDRFLRLKTEA
jgi:hypothetical protein